MFTDRPEMIAKSVRLLRIFLAFSLLIVCALPTNGFAEEKSSSSSPSSKDLVPETDKTESPLGEVEESQARDVPENQAVRAENYKQAWDDAMVAAPAFDD